MGPQTQVSDELFSNPVLNQIEAEQPLVNEDRLPHYAMSLFGEVPLYHFIGTKSFGAFTETTSSGESRQMQKIPPFVLIPITNSVVNGPAEYFAQGIPDRNNPEPFNANALKSGLTTRFSYTAKQNAAKLRNELGTLGVVLFSSLTGRDTKEAQALMNLIFPVNNMEIFPRITRTYRATRRTGIFADQVAQYFRSDVPANAIRDANLDTETEAIAWRLFEELAKGAESVLNFCSAQVERIASDISKGNRSPFSFAKDTPDSIYPFDFMVLAHLGMKEPNVSRPLNVDDQAQAQTPNNDLMKQLVASNEVMAKALALLAANNIQIDQPIVADIPATEQPISFTDFEETASNVSSQLFDDDQPKKRVLTDEQKAKMAEGRKKAKEQS